MLTDQEYQNKVQEIRNKIAQSKNKDTKHLSGMESLYKCCYSCNNYKAERTCTGKCLLANTHIKNSYIYKCNNYKEVVLIECEICGKFLRSLGQHVRTHGISATEYKFLYGYNKGTGLICSATKQMLHHFGNTQKHNLLKHNPILNGKQISNNNTTHFVNDEGRLNMSKAQRNMSDEHKKKIGDSHRGTRHKGHVKDKEWREKIGKAHKQRLKVVKRNIIRDSKGRIITYTEKYKKD